MVFMLAYHIFVKKFLSWISCHCIKSENYINANNTVGYENPVFWSKSWRSGVNLWENALYSTQVLPTGFQNLYIQEN